MISASSDSLIKVWDLNDFNLLANLEGHSDIICTIKKMSDNRLVSGSYDRKIKIWCLLKYVCIQTLTGWNININFVFNFVSVSNLNK